MATSKAFAKFKSIEWGGYLDEAGAELEILGLIDTIAVLRELQRIV